MNQNHRELHDYRQWNRRLMNLYWGCNGIILLTELILFLYIYLFATLWFPVEYHIIYIILLPTAIMLFLTITCELAVYLLRNRHKAVQPYIITSTCVAYCTVLLFIHNSINILSAAYCIPIIFAVIYNDKWVSRWTFYFSSVVYLCTCFFLNLNRSNMPYYNITAIDIITSLALFVATYLICKLIVSRYKQIADILATAERNAYESQIAKEYAESLAETRTRFFASMSHEIRTPMNVILGLTELALESGAFPIKEQEYLVKVKNSAIALLDIVNDILDISKIDAGEIKISSIPFQLHEVLSECEMLTIYEAKKKNLRVYFYNEIDPACCVLGDPTRLRQALINILFNAVKFTQKGSVTLLAKTEPTLSDENYITIYFEINDTGIGIPNDKLEEIFKPFKQANDTINQNFGGTGLGLAITKSIINSFGGTIEVTSIPDSGSRFSFSLSFPRSDIESVFRNNSNGKTERPVFEGDVLLCEDNELGRLVAAENLKRLGLKVSFALNGQEAIDAIAQRKAEGNPFSIIFMDIHMPVVDGLQATKKIIEMGVTTPIIALTANIMSKDKSSYLQAGMTECLYKPFRPYELWAVLAAYIKPIEGDSGVPVNEAMGLENNAGCNDIYQSSIKLFITDYQKRYDLLEKAITNKDFATAHRTAHTAKNNANIIGAAKLAELAIILEEALRRDGSYYKPELLTDYQAELRRVVDYLQKV